MPSLADLLTMLPALTGAQAGGGQPPPNPAAGGLIARALAQHQANMLNENQSGAQPGPPAGPPPPNVGPVNPQAQGLTPEQIVQFYGPQYLTPEQRAAWQQSHGLVQDEAQRAGLLMTILRALAGGGAASAEARSKNK